MSTDSNIKLSFCIPTYNRSHCIKKCIEWILEYTGNDIEIIVSDNDSSDDTQEILAEITDLRVKYFRNDKNEGAPFNIKRVLDEASGEFCFLLSDEDQVISNKIPMIIKSIDTKNVALAYVGIISMLKEGQANTWMPDQTGFFNKGEEAVSQIAFKHPYLSGILINKEMYENLCSAKPDWYKVDMFYPHEYLAFKLATMGGVLLLKEAIVQTHDYGNISFSGVEKIKSAYSYEGRLTTYRQRIDIILCNINDTAFIRKLMIDNYRTMIYCATVGYYVIAKDCKRSEALHIESAKLNLFKLIDLFHNDAMNSVKEKSIVIDEIFFKEARKIERKLKCKSIFVSLYGTAFYWKIKRVLKNS